MGTGVVDRHLLLGNGRAVQAAGRTGPYGETHDEALEQAREAALGYLEAAAKEQLAIPTGVVTDVVEIEVPAS